MEYNGVIRSGSIDEEAKIRIEEDCITLITLFDLCYIPYVDMDSFALREHDIHIVTQAKTIVISRLGNMCKAFYDGLYAAYNNKVRGALFVQGMPLLRAWGEYGRAEHENTAQGSAWIEVYEDCVLFLPPDSGARRVPLCFVTAMEQSDYKLTLWLDTHECYTFSKLGYDTLPFEEALKKQLHVLRQNALQRVKALDPNLTPTQASAIAKRMPEGVAVSLGDLAATAPTFVKALERRIDKSRAAESYAILKTICNPEQIYVGIRRSFTDWNGAGAVENSEPESAEAPNQNAEDGMMIWMIAPGENGCTAAVEFAAGADTAAATFLYRFETSFAEFARTFNRAVEAIGFRREVIRLRDADLQKAEYGNYAMAIRRNSALRRIRQSFSGRIIHSSLEHWQRELLSHMRQQ